VINNDWQSSIVSKYGLTSCLTTIGDSRDDLHSQSPDWCKTPSLLNQSLSCYKQSYNVTTTEHNTKISIRKNYQHTPLTFLAASLSSSTVPRSRPWAQAMRTPWTMLPTCTADGVTSTQQHSSLCTSSVSTQNHQDTRHCRFLSAILTQTLIHTHSLLQCRPACLLQCYILGRHFEHANSGYIMPKIVKSLSVKPMVCIKEIIHLGH